MANVNGKITQVIGAVVDVQFDGELPQILNSLTADNNGKPQLPVLQVPAQGIFIITDSHLIHTYISQI